MSGRSPACSRVHRIYFVEEPARLLDLFRPYAFRDCEREREGETERIPTNTARERGRWGLRERQREALGERERERETDGMRPELL